jgi:hypothetical protein
LVEAHKIRDCFVVLSKNVDGSLDQSVAAVVVEQAAGNFFELLVANDFRILRSDFVAHSRVIGCSGLIFNLLCIDRFLITPPEYSD